MQQPSVGRIVHYVSHGTPVRGDGSQAYASLCRAAIVTQTWPESPKDEVGLAVLNPTGMFFHPNIEHHAGDPDHVDATPDRPTYRVGTWHWPERV